MKQFLFIVLVALVAFSCKKKQDQAKIDDDKIKQYLTDNNLSATKTGSGLYYIIDSVGTGTQPSSYSNVTVVYKGYFTDNSVFDQSDPSGATFNLQNVIQGWREGIPYFNAGGSGMLLIPSALGYGSHAKSGIPANSVLLFDIQLLSVQ